ncbi:MAG: hypothetical protein V4543_08435 [Bacteroidota bacterium]
MFLDIKNSLNIIIATTQGKGAYTFPDQPNLKGRKVKAILSSVDPAVRTPDGNPVDPRLKPSGYLYLMNTKEEAFMDNIPFRKLDPEFNGNLGALSFIEAQEINWAKSKVNLAPASVNLTEGTTYEILLTVFFE